MYGPPARSYSGVHASSTSVIRGVAIVISCAAGQRPSAGNSTLAVMSPSIFMPPYAGISTRTECPSCWSIAGNAPLTSPRPPVLTHGAHSGVANRMFIASLLHGHEHRHGQAVRLREYLFQLERGFTGARHVVHLAGEPMPPACDARQ